MKNTEKEEVTFSSRLESAMRHAGIIQSELATVVHTTQQNISKIIKNNSCTLDNLKFFAKVLNVSSDYLLGLTDVETVDTNTRAICEYTGLSAEAVEVLHDYKESRVADSMLALINKLIEPLRSWSFSMYEERARVNGYDPDAYYEDLTPPPLPDRSDEELEREYKEYENIMGMDVLDMESSSLNGDSILQLLHSYLYTTADETLYCIDETGRIFAKEQDEPLTPNMTNFLNGRLIAERYFLDAITNELRKMKAEKQATNK